MHVPEYRELLLSRAWGELENKSDCANVHFDQEGKDTRDARRKLFPFPERLKRVALWF